MVEDGSAEAIRAAFSDAVKLLCCPSCGLNFTDTAVTFAHGYIEGRNDALEGSERDGPIKLQCELCAQKAFYDVFQDSVTATP